MATTGVTVHSLEASVKFNTLNFYAFHIQLIQHNARRPNYSQSVSLRTEPVVSPIGWSCKRGLDLDVAEILVWYLHQGTNHSFGHLGFEQDAAFAVASTLWRVIWHPLILLESQLLEAEADSLARLCDLICYKLFLGSCVSRSDSNHCRWQQMPTQSPVIQCPSGMVAL